MINRWYFEDLYAAFINAFVLLFGTRVYQVLDKVLFIRIFVTFPVRLIKGLTNSLKYPSVVQLETKFKL